MEPITAVDRLVLILRQKLQARERMRGAARSGPGATKATKGLRALDIAEIDDSALERAIIQNLLVDHFGQGMINDARFQQMVSRVTQTIINDPNGRVLMYQVIREVRVEGGQSI